MPLSPRVSAFTPNQPHQYSGVENGITPIRHSGRDARGPSSLEMDQLYLLPATGPHLLLPTGPNANQLYKLYKSSLPYPVSHYGLQPCKSCSPTNFTDCMLQMHGCTKQSAMDPQYVEANNGKQHQVDFSFLVFILATFWICLLIVWSPDTIMVHTINMIELQALR
jgi:hypothetical protein